MASFCFSVFQNSISPNVNNKSPQKKTSLCFKYLNNIYFLLKRQSPKIPFSSWLLTCFTNMKISELCSIQTEDDKQSSPEWGNNWWNNCFVWYSMVMVSNLCRSSSRVQFEHVPLGTNLSTFSSLHTHTVPALALMAWPDISMQLAQSSDTTQTRAAAPASMHQVQLLRKCLPDKQPWAISLGGTPQGPNPAKWKLEPVVRGNISGLESRTKKPSQPSQLPKISLQKISPGGLD